MQQQPQYKSQDQYEYEAAPHITLLRMGLGAGEDGDERDKAEEDVQEEASFTLADEAKLRSLHSTIALLLIHERMERRQQSQGAAALLRTTNSAHLRPPRLCPRFDARALRRS